jgi:hypothetical protein
MTSIFATDSDLTSAGDERTSASILFAEVIGGELFNSDNGINTPPNVYLIIQQLWN